MQQKTEDKIKALTTFFTMDVIVYVLISVYCKTFNVFLWPEMEALHFGAYVVFSFGASVFYYLSKRI